MDNKGLLGMRLRVYWGNTISEFPVISRFGVWKNLTWRLAAVSVRRVGRNALVVLSFYISTFLLASCVFFWNPLQEVSYSGNMNA